MAISSRPGDTTASLIPGTISIAVASDDSDVLPVGAPRARQAPGGAGAWPKKRKYELSRLSPLKGRGQRTHKITPFALEMRLPPSIENPGGSCRSRQTH